MIFTLNLIDFSTMEHNGSYYAGEIRSLIMCHGDCNMCGLGFEVEHETDPRYPYVSPVCKCTLCRACINECVPKVASSKIYMYGCPACYKDQAWNLKNLLPNRPFANLLSGMDRAIANSPKESSAASDGNDGHEDDHSNGGDYDDGSGKRKWRYD
jgi:hypothetical protein